MRKYVWGYYVGSAPHGLAARWGASSAEVTYVVIGLGKWECVVTASGPNLTQESLKIFFLMPALEPINYYGDSELPSEEP